MIEYFLTIYACTSCFLTGVQFESQRVYSNNKSIIFIWILVMCLICPLLYIGDWIIEITKKPRIKMMNWYYYFFKFNEIYTQKTIDNLKKYYEPKSKGLDKILIKKVYKKFARLNNK